MNKTYNTKQDSLPEKIFVTRPTLPDLKDFNELLKEIWDSRWLTNNGKFHIEFEGKLCNFLDIQNCSLMCNGTLALLIALQALGIKGEVITTPFSFVATSHSLLWNGIKPVFCDIDNNTLNIDPSKIEPLINKNTMAILPVHVYGTPCDVKRIQEIANQYELKVIYDAAHAFGVKLYDQSLLNYGDASVLSFHSTKSFNTIEGGAVITNDVNLKNKIDYLKNFGIADEVTVIGAGINAKMNELQAAFGLLQLKTFEEYRLRRQLVVERYRHNLDSVEGVKLFNQITDVKHNYSYFPVLIDHEQYGMTRDELYETLKRFNIYTRRYFYPLISHFPPYNSYDSAHCTNLPVAEIISQQILCLPLYTDLSQSNVDYISDKIISLHKHS